MDFFHVLGGLFLAAAIGMTVLLVRGLAKSEERDEPYRGLDFVLIAVMVLWCFALYFLGILSLSDL